MNTRKRASADLVASFANLGQAVDAAREQDAPRPGSAAEPESAPLLRRVGRPPASEKTTALLVRVPDTLHDWLTSRMVKETQDQRKPVSIQAIVLKILSDAARS